MSRGLLGNFSDHSRSSFVDGVPILTNPIDLVRFALFKGASEVDRLASYKRVERENAVMDRLNLKGRRGVFHACIIPKGRGFVKGKTSFSDRDSKPYERSCVGVARFHVCIIPSLVGFVKGRASVF